MKPNRPYSLPIVSILVGGVLWMLLAYPWLERIECLRTGPWNELKTLTITGDLSIWLPYMVMPVALTAMWRVMRARPEARLLVLYGSFILLCGLTHAMNVVTIFWPVYWLAAKLKILTGAVSLAVMVVTIQKRQQILDLGESGAALAREAENARRALAEADKQASEARAARAELAKANQALAEMNTKLESARASEERRAETAEERTAGLEEMVRRLQEKDVALAAQDEALRTQESPIMEALEGVLLSVLVGVMSSQRAADWTQRIATIAHAKQAKSVVIDVTGLTVIDTAVADTILKTVQILRIIGSECLMTGVRPEVAQTIVGLGVNLQGVLTLATLRQGLERAARKP